MFFFVFVFFPPTCCEVFQKRPEKESFLFFSILFTQVRCTEYNCCAKPWVIVLVKTRGVPCS
uniref:Uncharacterized protein n=1 Tax=Anguilla anguilla TaxID=7936 RepID=A0A0E9XDU0_ANGAN